MTQLKNKVYKVAGIKYTGNSFFYIKYFKNEI